MVTPASQIALGVEGLAFAFGGLQVLRSVSFTVEKGRITAVVGQNGAGKSTLLNLISGFRQPDRGRIFVGDGQVISGWPAHRRITSGIARTFQEVRAFPRLSALENVLLAVGASGGRSIWDYWRRPSRNDAAAALQCLRWVGLQDLADRAAAVLSFGQQRRLALAQLLATGATLALLDEPTAGLDPSAVTGLEDKLIELNGERSMTIVLIEHNLPFVRRVADSVIYLEAGEVALQASAVKVLDDPAFRRGYLGVA